MDRCLLMMWSRIIVTWWGSPPTGITGETSFFLQHHTVAPTWSPITAIISMADPTLLAIRERRGKKHLAMSAGALIY